MFDLITHLIGVTGALGVFILMLIENVFPPIPSEVIMPLAGYEAATGALSAAAVVIAGAAGSVLGGTVWYLIGRWLGLERLARFASQHGRWLTLSAQEIRGADRWFRRFGPLAVGVGRTLPGVRGLICIPAGVAGMPLGSFLLWCTIGSTVWSGVLTCAGYLLRENYKLVDVYIRPATTGFMLLCAATYLYRVITFEDGDQA